MSMVIVVRTESLMCRIDSCEFSKMALLNVLNADTCNYRHLALSSCQDGRCNTRT
jgi:hypothetical protein